MAQSICMNTWVGLRARLPLLFLNNNDPAFWTPFFGPHFLKVADPKKISGLPDKLNIKVQIDWAIGGFWVYVERISIGFKWDFLYLRLYFKCLSSPTQGCKHEF